jgi:putative ABC transport system permease protein
LNQTLKEGSLASLGSRSGRSFRNIVFVSEITLSFIALLGAGLLIRSFRVLANTDPGFDPKNLLTLRIQLSEGKYPEDFQISSFYERLSERMRALPGSESVGMINLLPLSGWQASSDFDVESALQRSPDPKLSAEYRVVDAAYFRVMGIALLAGRDFLSTDGRGAAPVAIVNATAAHRFWQGESPIGKHVRFQFRAPQTGPWNPRLQLTSIAVVGVVADTTEWHLGETTAGIVYLPYTQNPSPLMSLVMRTARDPNQMVSPVRQVIAELDRDLPATDVGTMNRYLDAQVSRPGLNAFIVALFSALATILSAIGIYGVVSYSVGQRTREIGVRMALGAGPRDVVRLIFHQSMRMALIGLGAGLLLGVAVLPRALSTFLFGVTAYDPIALICTLALLTFVAGAACLIPARQATAIDPLVALRSE